MTTSQLSLDRRSPPSSNEPIALAPSMIDSIARAHTFSPASTPVILYGESGTGKTFFAEYIHQLSRRSGGFHAFSVGTVAAQLALDELFGHVQGAYTDARQMRTGRIAVAGAGTLLLDDIQNLDLGVQKQLLQVLDRGTYSPVGSDRVLTVACRIVLAMTEDPDSLMLSGQLLKDLRYRFGACAIRIPPLSERVAEIPLLAQRALEHCPNKTQVSGPSRIGEAALKTLCNGHYDGNVRQLVATIEYAYLMARATEAAEIGPEHLPEGLFPRLTYHRRAGWEINRVAVECALRRSSGNIKEAARLLGISRNALQTLMTNRSRRSETSSRYETCLGAK